MPTPVPPTSFRLVRILGIALAILTVPVATAFLRIRHLQSSEAELAAYAQELVGTGRQDAEGLRALVLRRADELGIPEAARPGAVVAFAHQRQDPSPSGGLLTSDLCEIHMDFTRTVYVLGFELLTRTTRADFATAPAPSAEVAFPGPNHGPGHAPRP